MLSTLYVVKKWLEKTMQVIQTYFDTSWSGRSPFGEQQKGVEKQEAFMG